MKSLIKSAESVREEYALTNVYLWKEDKESLDAIKESQRLVIENAQRQAIEATLQHVQYKLKAELGLDEKFVDITTFINDEELKVG